MSRRAGFTLVELLVGLVITAVVGGAMMRLMMGELHFAEDREAWRTARQAARSGLTTLAADLRMLESAGGVEAAAGDGRSVTVRAPYGMGTLCATDGSVSTVALLPADSAMFAQPGHSGFAWRSEATGAYTYVPGGALATGASATPCTSAGITVLADGTVVTLTGTVPPGLSPGSLFLLYRRIQYEFKASMLMPGQTALWREMVTTGQDEEIAAPFDAGARFRYYEGSAATAQNTPPGSLADIIGLELAFDGRSDRTPRGSSGPKVVQFSASLFFQNRTP